MTAQNINPPTEEEKNFREFFQELEKAADIDDIKKRIRKFKYKK